MKIGASEVCPPTLIENVCAESLSLLKYLLTCPNQSFQIELLLLQLVIDLIKTLQFRNHGRRLVLYEWLDIMLKCAPEKEGCTFISSLMDAYTE